MSIENENNADTPADDTTADTSSSILDAINEAVGGEGDDTTADDAAASGDDAAAAAAGGDDTATTDETPAGTDKPPAGADQQPPAKDDKAAPALGADGKPAAAAAPKGPDPVNDPIPEEVRGKTRERMTALIDTAKSLTVEREKFKTDSVQFKTERDEILGYIAETKATPEQYTQALGYLKAVNSGDPVQIRAAIKTVQAELNALSSILGEPVAGVDLLANHQDLKTLVENGDLSQQHAEELAAGRNQRAHREQGSQQQTERQRVQDEINQGKVALNTLETQFNATDPHYAAKRAVLIPMLQPIFAQLHPSKWPAAFKTAYEQMPPLAPTAVPATVVPVKPAGQPLRARQPAGPAAKVPTTTMDAIDLAIEQAARR